MIKHDSLIIYEIKSGDQEKKLIRKMRKRCHFIYQHLKIIYIKPIYYIGFFKEKQKDSMFRF